MSMVLGSVRSHFFKHLSCTFLSSICNPHNLTPRYNFVLTRSTRVNLSRNNSCFLNFSRVNAAFSAASSASETSTTGSYLSVDIRCREDVADMLSEALLCFGATSTSLVEQGNLNSNDEVSIGSIFPVSQDVHQSISQAADSIGLEKPPDFKVTTGYQSDWIDNIRESFHPVEVTNGLWVVPEWRTPPDLQATNVVLNPGLAFGTGDHPTTKLCLLLLRGLIKGGELVLDYGTGSGILAIAALKFGAASSLGFDIDPQAIIAARHNAALNNIGPEKLQLELLPSNIDQWATNSGSVEEQNLHGLEIISEKGKYDVVLANILLNPLLNLADQIVYYAKPGAIVGLSGIILEQVPTITERYIDLLEDINVSKLDDWACISGRKRKSQPVHHP